MSQVDSNLNWHKIDHYVSECIKGPNPKYPEASFYTQHMSQLFNNLTREEAIEAHAKLYKVNLEIQQGNQNA